MLQADGRTADTVERVRAIALDNIRLIVAGEATLLRRLYTDDAQVWHSFDEQHKPIGQVAELLGLIAAKVTRLRYDDLVLHVRTDGWVQEHTLRVDLADAASIAIPAMISARVNADGRIESLREYIDGDRVRAVLTAVGAAI